jgi:putative SOS response-associated peptidase YedK
MCGRYYRDLSWAQYRERLTLIRPTPDQAPNCEPKHDIRPTTQQLVARPADGGVELVDMRWGLVPFFHRKSLKEWKATTFNARCETAATSPAFRGAFSRRRCLVPASGWYEWTGTKGSKIKHRFARADGDWIMFAGLWDKATCGEETVESFTLLTTAAGEDSQPYHDREPVVLEPEDWAAWLDSANDAAPLLACRPPGRFTVELAA